MDIELSGKQYTIKGTLFERSCDIVWIDDRQMTLEEFDGLTNDDRGYLQDAIAAYIEMNAPPSEEVR